MGRSELGKVLNTVLPTSPTSTIHERLVNILEGKEELGGAKFGRKEFNYLLPLERGHI